MTFSVVFDIEGRTRVAALIMSKAPRHRGVTSTSVKVALHLIMSNSPPAPRACTGRGCWHQPEPGIVDESARLREYQGDGFATDPVPSNYAHGARAHAQRGASRGAAE